MVKMQIAGIQIEVNESDVAAYKRAGYSVLEDKPVQPEPVAAVIVEEKPEPSAVMDEDKPEKKTGKK